MAEFLQSWDDSSSEEHSPLPLLSSKSDISSYYDPEGWSDDELYALFGEELEAVEEEDEDDDDGGGTDNGGGSENDSGRDNGDGMDSGDEAMPPAKRHNNECGSFGAKDSD
jgi:hypothetical protein